MSLNVFSTAVFGSALVLLAACQPVPPSTEQQAVPTAATTVADPTAIAATQNPIVTSDFGRGGAGGEDFSMVFRFKAIERNGEVFVCGAMASRGLPEAHRIAQQLLLRGQVFDANGNAILGDLRFFNGVSRSNFSSGLVGVETNCQPTGNAAGTIDLDAISIEGRGGQVRVPKM